MSRKPLLDVEAYGTLFDFNSAAIITQVGVSAKGLRKAD